MAPWDMKNVFRKMEKSGNHKIFLKKGSSFCYINFVVYMIAIKKMKKLSQLIIMKLLMVCKYRVLIMEETN